MRVVGIDIGGTMIKYGLLSLEGQILKSGEMATEAEKGVEILFEKICSVVENFSREEKILGIAV